MQPFTVKILGCGSALPTAKHSASSQIVELRGKTFMIDCGEGTQVQLRRAHVHFNKIIAVFISHLHGDHCFGLLGMISTLGLLGRTSPLHVYAPAEFEQLFNMQLDMFCNRMDYKVVFHGVDTAVLDVIYDDRSLTVTTVPLNHRTNCCGFIFREKPSLPHIRRDMTDFYGIPQCYLNNIKNGADWTMPDGTVIPNSRLTAPADKPRAYAYCSDTKYIPALHEHLKDVDMLYHEATYCEEDAKRAELYYHSTARQAAQVAKDACAGRLILGHFSARYNNEEMLLKEACDVFPNSFLASEMKSFDV